MANKPISTEKSGKSDEDLMRDVAVGEEQALELIVERYAERLQRYVGRLLGAQHPDIEDVVLIDSGDKQVVKLVNYSS